MLEMAVLTPLLLFLILAGLEYARALERIQWASQLSREVASQTYRECSARDPKYMDDCTRLFVLDQITSKATALAPNSQFVVAVFSFDNARVPKIKQEMIAGPAAYRTKFDALGFNESRLNADSTAGKLGSAGLSARRNRVIVVGTAFIPMGFSLAGALPRSFRTFTEIHATTVM